MKDFEDLPIGIDLGTTYSCIGVYRNASVEIIPNEKGDRTTPSVVSFDDGIYVGEQTEYKRIKDPKNKIYAVKRIIGRNFDDKEIQDDIKHFSYEVINDNNSPKIRVFSNRSIIESPEEISARILNKLKKNAELFLHQKIKKVVITVPAYFTERQKQATKKAGEIAGLDVIKIINEPTAAALAYGFGKVQNNKVNKILGKNIIYDDICQNTFRSGYSDDKSNKKETQNILVFDLGGGTLDVTLLELEEGDITVKLHEGKHLGGEDFDNELVQFCIKQFKTKTSIDLNKEEFIKQKLRLKDHCEKAKRILSYSTEAEIEIESIAQGKDFYLKILRDKFEEICEELFNSCKEPIDKVLQQTKKKKNDIDEIVLVGGSTRIPKIQSILKEYFNGKELNKRLNPDEAVAYGATIEAAIQMGNYAEDVVLLDVCSFSLGIAVVDHDNQNKNSGKLMSKVINKGTKLPCEKKQIFVTHNDNQTEAFLEVYEGENEYVKNNYPLGTFTLCNLPPKKAGEVEIEVTFNLDGDSILTVTAVEKDNVSNNDSIIIINDKGGLSQNEIEKAKINQENETIGKDMGPAIAIEKNYKNEMNKLLDKINNLTVPNEQYFTLLELQKCIEEFVGTFKKDNIDNYTYKQKMFYYLSYLFGSYSATFNFKNLISEEEKSIIIAKVKNYLEIYKNSGTSYGASLIKIFNENDNEIFLEFCLQILSYYSQRGTEYYHKNEKKLSKHYFEEALSIIKKYCLEEKVENHNSFRDSFKEIFNNCDDLINILKAESIEKYCKSFSKDVLIKENEFETEEKKIDILDRFKDALSYVKNPKKREDKLLKAMYIANIVKIEFKIFNSNNYDTLLKMVNECINLKVQVPEGCGSLNLGWFKELCKIKIEIEQKQKNAKENPKDEEIKIKTIIKDILVKIEEKSKKKIEFFYYILSEHKPNGLEDDFIFNKQEQLEKKYNSDPEEFMKKLRKLYYPIRYKGHKEEERKVYYIMEKISMELNNF